MGRRFFEALYFLQRHLRPQWRQLEEVEGLLESVDEQVMAASRRLGESDSAGAIAAVDSAIAELERTRGLVLASIAPSFSVQAGPLRRLRACLTGRQL